MTKIMIIKKEVRTRENYTLAKDCIVSFSKLNDFDLDQISYELAKRDIFELDPNIILLYVSSISKCAIVNGCLFVTYNIAVCLK